MSSEDRPRLFIHAEPEALVVPKLQEYFQQFGSVSDLYVPINRQTGAPKGIAFVTFEEDSGVDAALAVETHDLDGHALSIKKAEPRNKASYQPGHNRGSEATDHYRIFIPELPTTLGKTDLEEHFSKFGDIKDVHLPPLSTRGHSSGRQVAFVTFKTAVECTKALAEKHMINGLDFEIKRAAERPPMPGKGDKGGKGGSFGAKGGKRGKGSWTQSDFGAGSGGGNVGNVMSAGFGGMGMGAGYGMSAGMGMSPGMGMGMMGGMGMVGGMGMQSRAGADGSKALTDADVQQQVQMQVQAQVQQHLQLLHQVRRHSCRSPWLCHSKLSARTLVSAYPRTLVNQLRTFILG
jgi:RNA-binding protein Musashi